MKKIIHMSDLHLGYQDFKDRFANIVDDLKAGISAESSEYIVVITGDLVNNANQEEGHQEARQALAYLRQAGFEHILVIPGNHDYGSGNLGRKKFVPLFKKAFYGTDLEYPKVDIIDGVAFIGLDSMAEELHLYNELWAQGQLGREQIGRLEGLLSEERIKSCVKRVIYLHHHPFRWRPLHQLKDARKLRKVLKQAMDQGITIDALLFGHNHEGNAHNGNWGIPRCYDAGTATLKPRPKYVAWATWFKIQSSIRIFDLETDPAGDFVLSHRYQKKNAA